MLPAEGGTEFSMILGLLNVEGTEFMMILLVALLVFGPERLPEVARKAAKAITSVRRMSDAFQNELRSAVDLPIDPLIKAQSGSSLSDVMNRLTAEAEAEEAAAKLAAKEGEGDDDSSASTDTSSDDAPSSDPFAGSVRDPMAPTTDADVDADEDEQSMTPSVSEPPEPRLDDGSGTDDAEAADGD